MFDNMFGQKVAFTLLRGAHQPRTGQPRNMGGTWGGR